MADEVWLDVLPSMAGFGPELAKGASKAAKSAGQKSGKDYSAAFKSGAAGASEAAVQDLETSSKRSAAIVSKLSGQVSTSRQAQKRSAADLLTAEQRLADAQAKYGDESNQAQAASLRLEAAREKASTATRKFEGAENALKEAQRGHRTITDQLAEAQAGLTTEVKQAPGLWGKLGDTIGNAGGKLKSFSESTGGMVTKLAGLAGGAALFSEAFGASLGKEVSLDTLDARLAATPAQSEAYGAAAGELFSNGMGTGMEDVTDAVDAVVSSMGGMRNAGQEDIEAVTGYALNLSKAFGVDVAESSATAGTLMKNGLAKDATQAMDLITGAMNKVPANLRGEVLPVMDEYSKHFSSLGIDGETAMGIIAASSQDGAIGMDKMGDALKEFTIRGTDMSKTTNAAYESLGLNTKQMTNDLLAGGDTAEGAMAKIVHGLQGIKDPAQQSQAALALFGTPLEDLGTDQIPNFLGMIDPMGDAFDSTAGSAEALGTTLNGNTSASIETIKRSFGSMLTDGITPLLGPLNGVLTWARETPGVMTAVGIALGVVAVAWAAVTLAASPWLALGLGIALVIGGVILAVKNWGTIMNWLGEIAGNVATWISDRWNGMITGIVSWWTRTLKPTIDAMGLMWRFMWASYVKPALDAIGSRWGSLIGGIVGWWTGTLKPTLDRIGLGTQLMWEDYIQPALSRIGTGWDNLMSGIRTVWNTILKPVFETIASVVKGDLPGAFEHGTEAIKGIWNGIRSIAAKPINFVIDTVYNNGLRRAFNLVADVLPGVDTLDKLPTIAAHAKGGLAVPGWALVGEEGPELVNFDNPGRVYTAAQTASALANHGELTNAQREAAAGNNPSEAVLPMGGIFSDAWEWARNTGVGRAIESGVGKAIDWTRGRLADAAGGLLNPMKAGLNTLIPGGGIAAMGRSAATDAIDNTLKWLRGKDKQDASAGQAVYNGPLGAFHRPSAGPITSGYGPRWGGFHSGIDIAGGGPTYAALPGVVQRVGWNAVPGKTGIGIYLNHGPGLWTYYGHNPVGGPQVKVGDHVRGGQHIGYQGATGNVTGVHTHFEVHKGHVNGIVNPAPYLYDEGGPVPPGTHQILNATGRTEQILNPEQIADARAVVESVGHSPNQYYFTVPDKATAKEYLEEAQFQTRRLSRTGARA
ncbi:peptidoglycan DD-metalloendopeptidase family protein [Micrococcaceae bacterium RIT802]|nr:peptidoglycan DD-metalloendopeptidase family protein [Micrococcaceae bacterium RIT 802]